MFVLLLQIDEATIIRGALDMTGKTVSDVCTPSERMSVLSPDTVLNDDTMSRLRRQAFSRVPVRDQHGRYVGVLLTSRLVGVAGNDNLRVSDLDLFQLSTGECVSVCGGFVFSQYFFCNNSSL